MTLKIGRRGTELMKESRQKQMAEVNPERAVTKKLPRVFGAPISRKLD